MDADSNFCFGIANGVAEKVMQNLAQKSGIGNSCKVSFHEPLKIQVAVLCEQGIAVADVFE